jgi:nicotinate-nucleotide pyrophosphorylase (carboxylating)
VPPDSTSGAAAATGDESTNVVLQKVVQLVKSRRLPHDRSSLLWDDEGATALLNSSTDRWVSAMLADDRIIAPIEATKNGVRRAHISSREDGVLCGLHAAERMLKVWAPHIKYSWLRREGESLLVGDAFLILEGNKHAILRIERALLNLISKMSGIATNTKKWVDGSGKCEVAATRKTEWGLLDKWAVHVGGGLTHRLNRSDSLIIKENDIAALRGADEKKNKDVVKRLIGNIDLEQYGKFIVIEVNSLGEALAAGKAWCSRIIDLEVKPKLIIMLDNFGPEKTKEAVLDLDSHGYLEWCFVEASGNIIFDELDSWAMTGAHVLSTSALNRGVRPLDLTLMLADANGSE